MFKPPALALPPLPGTEVARRLGRQLPMSLVRQTGRLPFGLQRFVLREGMTRAFQEALADGDFDFLEHRWLRVEITDAQLSWCIGFDGQSLLVEPERPADACIRGQLREFLLLASRAEDPDSLFFQRRLMIEGDTEIGLEAKNLMDGVDEAALPRALRLILPHCGTIAQRLF